MASLNFIKGTLKVRVGQFVGSSWSGKEYIKTFGLATHELRTKLQLDQYSGRRPT